MITKSPKVLLLLILLAFFYLPVVAMQWQLTQEEMISRDRFPKTKGKAFTNSSSGQQAPAKLKPPFLQKPQPNNQLRSTQGACPDTSLLRILNADQRSFSFWCSATTADGGVLLGGTGRDISQGPPYYYMGVVIKLDKQGNPVWAKEVKSDVYYQLSIESIKEMSDGSIVLSGTHSNVVYYTTGNEYSDFFVCKLSAAGNMTWMKTFHQKLPSSCTSVNVYESSIGEGKNGDILISGTIWNCPLPKYLLAMKLNSAGDLQWKYSFLDAIVGDAYGVGIFYQNDEVVLINKSSNFGSTGDNVIHVDFVRLNYNTGTYINQKSWKVDKNPLDAFYYSYINSVNAVQLTNGNYVVYGQTFGDMQQNSNNRPKISILEFNSDFEFLNGYTINSTIITNYSETRMDVNEKGTVAFGLTTILSNENKDKYIGTVKRGILNHQRKKEFRGYEYFYDHVEVFDDDSYAYIHNLATPGQSRFDLQYGLLHNTDTGSSCLGESADFCTTEEIRYVPYTTSFVSINPDPLGETMNRGNSTADLIFTASPPCIQIATCNSVQIKGDSAACDIGHLFSFTASKSSNCGATVKWRIDTSSVLSLSIKNDSTIAIIFKKSWQGKLYADIFTTCGTVSDSVQINYAEQNAILNLGKDTSICPGNQITLNAGAGFTSYSWNNNVTDSAIIVTAPGKYFVSAINACGTKSGDTIIVNAAPPVVFDIGKDTGICINQKLILQAPANFISYSWGNDNNVIFSATQQVEVYPQNNTFYFLKAEERPGCFGYDTIRVNVKPVPQLSLPGDTSLCAGDTLTLDAGSGFKSYQWSNGSTTQSINAAEAKSFSVTVTNADGCTTADTTNIVNIWPLPVVNLGNVNGICVGEEIILNAGNYAQYLWHDGSTTQQYKATTTGIYYVAVTDVHGCRGNDTIIIDKIFEKPVNFLSADTGFCKYETLTLKTIKPFTSYQWSTGSTSSAILINTAGNFWLNVKDNNGCNGTDTIMVTQKDCIEGFNMPNAFTPNNDRLNDELKPLIGGKLILFRLSVFNRWGEIIFTSSDHLTGWDGRFKGIIQNPGQYIWTCTYQLEGQLPQTKKGTVTLIR
jgi:gliding motility-associated-like protein